MPALRLRYYPTGRRLSTGFSPARVHSRRGGLPSSETFLSQKDPARRPSNICRVRIGHPTRSEARGNVASPEKLRMNQHPHRAANSSFPNLLGTMQG